MNNPKNMLLIALIFLGFLLYIEWQKDYAPKPGIHEEVNNLSTSNSPLHKADTDTFQTRESKSNGDVPDIVDEVVSAPLQSNQIEKKHRPTGSIITINTNVLKLKIDTLGASIVYAELLKYPISKGAKENVVLLNQSAEKAYYAQSGLLVHAATICAYGYISNPTNTL